MIFIIRAFANAYSLFVVIYMWRIKDAIKKSINENNHLNEIMNGKGQNVLLLLL